VHYRVLGPLEVVDAGESIRVAGAKERALLARLLLSANEVVSVDRLVDDLWEGGESDQAVPNLRVYVSRLRKALGGVDRLATRAPGYVLRVEPGELDASSF
jgi:DNA-binding SARP family transcriptional activator